jgi:quinol monooxygenase YgiN
MAEYVRIFHSSVDPADIEEIRALFAEDVAPAFTARNGCVGIELLISCDKNAGGLVEGAAISRWSSREDMEEAMASREVREALVRILQLLRQEPVTRIFEVTA